MAIASTIGLAVLSGMVGLVFWWIRTKKERKEKREGTHPIAEQLRIKLGIKLSTFSTDKGYAFLAFVKNISQKLQKVASLDIDSLSLVNRNHLVTELAEVVPK